jgi:hypothetical protein
MTVTTMPTTVTILVRVLQVPELPDVSGCKPYEKEFDAGSCLYAAARMRQVQRITIATLIAQRNCANTTTSSRAYTPP